MSSEGFFGPNESSLVDLIQMWGLAKTTGILTIKSGKEDAEVHFDDGMAVWAKAGDYLHNEEAIYHTLALEEGKFRFVTTRDINSNGNFRSSYHELIMEGMRKIDHLKVDRQEIDDKLGYIPHLVKEIDHETLKDEERVLLSLIDNKKNLEKVMNHCGLGQHKSFEVYKKLFDEGVIALRKVRVLVVDDQPMWRSVISKMLSQETCFEVVGAAEDGVIALKMLSDLQPDVMTLDLEMPRMDGLKTLYWMMSGGYDILLKSQHDIEIEDTYRCPVVVISAVATKMAPETLEALLGGATSYITKPSQFATESIEEQQQRIAKTVLMASQVDLMKTRRIKTIDAAEKNVDGNAGARKIVCVGASMVGGLTSLMQLIPQLEEDMDAAMFVIIDDLYSIEHARSFVEFLDKHSKIKVITADKPALLKRGCVYIASGDKDIQFGVTKVADKLHAAYKVVSMKVEGVVPPDFKPLDNMLFSAIKCKGFDKRVGVVLAGDGGDGKVGFLELVKCDAKVFAQDSYSSLNPIKPENVASTGVARIIPLGAMGKNILMEVGRSV